VVEKESRIACREPTSGSLAKFWIAEHAGLSALGPGSQRYRQNKSFEGILVRQYGEFAARLRSDGRLLFLGISTK
jgi:hypothetical protein